MINYCDQAQGSNRSFYQHYRAIGGGNAHFDFPTAGNHDWGSWSGQLAAMSGELVVDHPVAGASLGGRYLGGVQHGSRTAIAGMSLLVASSAALLTGCSLSDDMMSGLGPEVETAPAHGQSSAQLPGPAQPGPQSNALVVTPRQRAYLDALRAAGVTPSSDLTALSIGSYVCQARAARQTDQAVWDFVAPLVRNDVSDTARRRRRQSNGAARGRGSFRHLRLHSDRDRRTLLAGAKNSMAKSNRRKRHRLLALFAAGAVGLVVVLIVAIVIVVLRSPDTPPTAVPPSAVPPTAVPPTGTKPRPEFQDASCPDVQLISIPGTWESSVQLDPFNPVQFPAALLLNVTNPIRATVRRRSGSRCSPFRTPRSSTIRCRRTSRCPTTTAAPRAPALRCRR